MTAVLERNLALRDLSGRGLRRLHLGVEAAHGLARELLGRLEAPIAGALAQRERRRLVHVLEQIVQRSLIGMGQRGHGATIGNRPVGHEAADVEGHVAQLIGMVVVDFGRAHHLGVTINGKRRRLGAEARK